MEKIKGLGYEIKMIKEGDVPDYEYIKDIEIMVCFNPFKNLDVELLPNLKWIQLSSIGIDQVPKRKILENNIIVTNNRGGYSIPMGEWIVLKILELMKNSADLYKNQQNKIWKTNTGVLELYNKKILFIGTGTIAFEAAKRLQGFECEICGINTNGRDVLYFNKCFQMEKLNNVITDFDVIVITIPSTERTFHMIDDSMFKKMKKGALLINVSRGNIIDDRAFIENIKSGKIGGAALDVFVEEPLKRESPLWELDNVIITPHNSWVSERRNERRFSIIYENMKKYISGEALSNIVDVEKGY